MSKHVDDYDNALFWLAVIGVFCIIYGIGKLI
jgi:hypothetical protein